VAPLCMAGRTYRTGPYAPPETRKALSQMNNFVW
jgi:hypothetical protein